MANESAGTSADEQDAEHTTREMTILQTFREQLYAEDILHDGDTVGTDDETLLYALTLLPRSTIVLTIIAPLPPPSPAAIATYRRFLRARKFDLAQAKKMFIECQHWRTTVEGIGIDELYKRIDPFDVSYAQLLASIAESYFGSNNHDRLFESLLSVPGTRSRLRLLAYVVS